MRIGLLAIALLSLGCGADDAGTTGAGETSAGSSVGVTSMDNDSSGSTSADSTTGSTSSASAQPTETSDDPGTTTDDPSTTDGDETTDDTSSADPGPTQLYRGSVADALVPGWDPQNPRPLVMMGRLGADWVATLARIEDDGTLTENVAEEIIVWGWDDDPPLLYDGPVGGALEPWNADAPHPVVLLGYRRVDGAWYATLSSIDAAGTLGDNVSDRLVVWGWSSQTPTAPSSIYDGPVIGGAVPGWDADDPAPLVMLGRLPKTQVWLSTLASISPDGSLGMNVAEQIIVWGWG